MTSAKLLSAIEPVIRYHRGRFRGGENIAPGSPRYELGLQMKEDVLHRLVDVWATGEAGASLGFEAARLFDELDPLERRKDEIFAKQKVEGTRAQMKVLGKVQKDALEFLALSAKPVPLQNNARLEQLRSDALVQYILLDSLANVLCPACKLWNTGHGANMMREAVSLMGGYGITEDCPGFLGHKWMDAQLEATYEGPEAVQRRQLSVTMTNELFLARYRQWIQEMRQMASTHPGTGACTVATAMRMWLWTLNHLQESTDADGTKLYSSSRQGVTFPLADALCWLLATRSFILDVLELEKKGPDNPVVAEALPGLLTFMIDLCHVQAVRACGEVGRICAELVHGYKRHPAWTEESCNACYQEDELDAIEGLIPGIADAARGYSDVIEPGQLHPTKAGPCVRFDGLETFLRLRTKLDGCLTGARLAKDRAATSLSKVMIPEALDYPA
jgi:alkylation response protein AidB-like acyl-CoA dehydrogenase